jgi:hypothetical protein
MKRISLVMLFFVAGITASVSGCGSEPGAHTDDKTPGGEPSAAISDDPEEVAGQMGEDYGAGQPGAPKQ